MPSNAATAIETIQQSTLVTSSSSQSSSQSTMPITIVDSNESTLPTVLVLPSGEFKIEDYKYLIGNLVKDQYRVIAIELPGKLT